MSAADLRATMIDHLRIIASPERQREYQRKVPHANVADELVCQWFDNFHPQSDLFRKAFAEREIELLQWFSRVFHKKVPSLPNNLELLLHNPEWEHVMRQARLTLQANNWDKPA